MTAKLVKKILCTALVTVSLGIFTGCSSDKAADPGQSEKAAEATESKTEEKAEAPGETVEEMHKIGVILYGRDDNMGAAIYSYLNHAAEVLKNVELVWDIGAFDVDAQISSTQNLIAAGCEGIICLPMSDDTVAQMSDICKQANVYFSLMFRDITDETIRNDVYQNPYFLGFVREDDAAVAKAMVKELADAGVTHMGVQVMASGNPLSVRNDGMYEGAEEYGITIDAEFPVTSSGDVNGNNTYIQNTLDSYPDVQAIYLTSASIGLGEGAANLLGSLSDPGSVKLASFDVFDGMSDAFENEILVCAAGGVNPDALFSFMVLYNAVDGNRLSEDVTELYQNFLLVTSSEECKLFEKYVGNTEYQIYTDEQIKNLAVRFNPNVTLKDYEDLMDLYSLEWLQENEH